MLGLTSYERKVLGVLVKRPALCPFSSIGVTLYGDREDPPMIEDLIRVWVHRIRRKLEPHAVEIGCIRGQGYFITPDNLNRLNALYAPGERP